MVSTVMRAGQFIDRFKNPMTMPRGAGEQEEQEEKDGVETGDSSYEWEVKAA
jgi:hypothetical protein